MCSLPWNWGLQFLNPILPQSWCFECSFFSRNAFFEQMAGPWLLRQSLQLHPVHLQSRKGVGFFPVFCSNKTSCLALIWICLCSRGVRTLAPPLGNAGSSSLKLETFDDPTTDCATLCFFSGLSTEDWGSPFLLKATIFRSLGCSYRIGWEW